MDPEEAAVPLVGVALSHGLAGILVEEFADHGLGDGEDYRGIGGDVGAAGTEMRAHVLG